MNMTDTVKKIFSAYGFSASPLTDEEIKKCLDAGLTPDDVYNIGCDTHAGFTFESCFIDTMAGNPSVYKRCNAPI